MSKSKSKPIIWLLIVLIVLFVMGMASEIVLKFVSVILRNHQSGVPAGTITNQILRQFGTETVPLCALPSAVLNLMLIQPKNVWMFALRWLPYLVLFLLPVFTALIRGRAKAAPLLVCAVIAAYEGISMMIASMSVRHIGLSVYTSIPFMVEFILLLLGCVGLLAKNKPLSIVIGVISILLVPVSFLLTPIINVVSEVMHAVPLGSALRRVFMTFPNYFAASHWPIFKTFAFLMYGLIFISAGAGKRKA